MTLGGRTVAGVLHPRANCHLNADVVDYRRPAICRETVCRCGTTSRNVYSQVATLLSSVCHMPA